MRRRAVAPAALSVFVLLALALPGMARAAEPAAALQSAGPAQSVGPAQSAGGGAYLAELVARARELKLWEERLWHLLLHYRPNTLFAGVTSEADGPGFFNAPEGKTNPQAELEGTLARFFSTAILDPGKMTSQCTFPARYHWLDAKLGFDPGRLRVQTCTRFDNWRRSLDPSSISLVFASYYFNNPASMFGHTLLVYNKKGRPEKEWLLNYAVNYAASIPPDAA
ncbi:MAG: DUF4105 domain-containing protein, partial [bacterium]